MTIWKIFSILVLAVPVCVLVLGLICWRYPPKGPTWALGYRSRRARASDTSWLYAQELAGQIWFCQGTVLLIAALAVCISLRDKEMESAIRRVVFWIITQDVLVLLSLIPVEVQLTRRFDRFGRPRRAFTGEDSLDLQVEEVTLDEPYPENMPYEEETYEPQEEYPEEIN